MEKVITKGRHVLGKLSRNCDKAAPRNCEAALTWELREDSAHGGKLEFSAQGEVWNHLKTDIVRGGQCVGELAALFPRDTIAQRIAHTWSHYHLNGMNAGTPEQSACIATLPDDVRRDYTKTCEALSAAGLLDVPVTDELRASALGGVPESATTYRYGTLWLYRAIPADVVALIRRGFAEEGETVESDASEAGEAGEPTRDLIAKAGLTVGAVFVPFSQSRNAKEKHPSLNWRVTLQCKGRDVLTCDYSAGSAHCPADKKNWSEPHAKREAVRLECETGKAAREFSSLSHVSANGPAIMPNDRDVIASLLLDASVLDAWSFADWAADCGYSDDSRKARAIYDECLAHALAFQAAVGAYAFAELREAAR